MAVTAREPKMCIGVPQGGLNNCTLPLETLTNGWDMGSAC
jgi:hypothetical protein